MRNPFRMIDIPINSLFDATVEFHARLPSYFTPRSARINRIAAIVSRPVGNKPNTLS
jgi:hypothetical protein